jgi:hypothetical protein
MVFSAGWLLTLQATLVSAFLVTTLVFAPAVGAARVVSTEQRSASHAILINNQPPSATMQSGRALRVVKQQSLQPRAHSTAQRPHRRRHRPLHVRGTRRAASRPAISQDVHLA